MIRPVKDLEQYKYAISEISLMSSDFDEPVVIQPIEVQSISILNDYDNNVVPNIFITANLKREYYEKVVTHMKKMVATFTLYRSEYVDVDGEQKINYNKPYMSGTFKVSNNDLLDTRIPAQLKNSKNDLHNTTQETLEFNINIYDHNSLEKYKKCISYILNCSTNDILFHMFKDRGLRNILMTSIQNSETKDFSIEYGTLGDNLKSLNKYYGIYDTEYTFFMNFNETYFLDKSNLGKTLKTNELSTVNMYLEKSEERRSIDTGCYIDLKNGYYILNASPFSVNDSDSLIDFYSAGKVTTSVVGSKKSNTDIIGDYNVERPYSISNPKERNQILYKINESKRSIVLEFSDVDIDILTPNKKFYLIADTFYNSDYNINGLYRLTSSCFILSKRTEDTMKSVIQCRFNKVKDI